MTIYGEKCKIPFKEITDADLPAAITIETDSPYKYSVIGIGGPTIDVYLVFIDDTETIDAYQHYNETDNVIKNPATYDFALDAYQKLVN